MKTLLFVIMGFMVFSLPAQVGIGTQNPDPSAMLDVRSDSSGFAMPRMSAEDRLNISNPVPGLQVYDTTYKAIWFYDGTQWRSVTPLAYGRVQRDGHPRRIVGATVERLGTGHYKITFNTPMPGENYIITLSLRKEDNHERDDITIYWRYMNEQSFEVFIQDNDNGFDDGIPTDNMFLFSVFY